MSFILDALRKSEHARQHLGGATLAELPMGRRTRGQPWWVFALAALLVVNLIVLTVVLLRNDKREATVAQNSVPVANAPAPAAASIKSAPAEPLAEEAAPPADVQYETIARDESPLAGDAPEGPTLVKRIDDTTTSSNALPTTASGMPELRIDMHVYAKNPKDRFVFINMHKYTEGQSLAEGPRVAEITADGVILFYQGQQLSLPRP